MLAHCIVSVSAIRLLPQSTSEMHSQILFGESCEILEKESDFFKIKMNLDGTEGWVLAMHLQEFSECKDAFVLCSILHEYSTEQGRFLLSLGSEIPELLSNKETISAKESLQKISKDLLNVPFMNGGRTVFGMDADGFVQLCYKCIGHYLPRKAHQQAELGMVLDFLWESDLGDLAFFEDENGAIVHVGIMLNNAQVIHCYDKVRVDDLDTLGIYNRDLKKHTHKLRFIKRIL